MTTIKTIAAAISRSISHNEIVHVSLDDLLDAVERKQMNEAANEWDKQAYMDHRADVVSGLMCDEQDSHEYCDSVLSEDVVEMWGTVGGSDYRVHISL